MSSNEPRDDEILGRALSRAIETQDARETPYETSRLAVRPVRRGVSLMQLASLAAALVAVLSFGAWLTRPTPTEPVAAPPSSIAASPTPVATLTPAPSPSATNGAQATALDHDVIYVGRLGLPPVTFHFGMPALATSREDRIAARITGLRALRPDAAPPGSRNFLWNNAFQGGVNVTISGELATVDLLLENKPWAIPEVGAEAGIVQQLVYTATEEPGIRAVLFTHDRGQQMRVGQFVFSQPLTRENVSGYRRVDPQLMSEEWVLACAPTPCASQPVRLSNSHSVDYVAMGVTRFTIQVDSGQPPNFSIEPAKIDDSVATWAGKYVLRIDIAGVETKPGLSIVDRTPLRSVRSRIESGHTTYELGLDDLRPWRVVMLKDPQRIVIDLGGYVTSVSDTIAVYAPAPGDPPVRQFTVNGLATTFEANVSWRVRDNTQRVVASGTTTASVGTSRQWGTFQFLVQVPTSAAPGDLWLEVYWVAPKDGTEQGLVRVQLKVG
jgi:hypothetical protein